MYAKTFIAGWGDMDFNAHMRNTSFLDRAADVRMMFFADHGFSMAAFRTLGIGPVIMKDEVEYFRELRLLESFSVTLELAGLARDGSRFLMANEVVNADGKHCARITSTGGWLDIAQRRLVAAPEALRAALHVLPHTDAFIELPASATASG